jgi:hypothetical protein
MRQAEFPVSSQKTTLVAKYGKRNEFLVTYNPSLQQRICTNEMACYFGDFPTLATIRGYGDNTPVAWLIPQLYNLSEFCGCKDKLQGESLEECAGIISSNYYYLKVSEIMLFLYRFKAGRYGHFYGSVDPLVIMTTLKTFMQERSEAYFRKEQEDRAKRDEESKKNAISYEEYCENKARRSKSV